MYTNVDLSKTNNQDLVKQILRDPKSKIRNCARNPQALPSQCHKCKHPCDEGSRIVFLSYGIVREVEQPKYEGSMLEAARKAVKKGSGRKYMDGWYDLSLMATDQVKWVMENFGIKNKDAKAKIFGWEYRHPEDKARRKMKESGVGSYPYNAEVVVNEKTEEDATFETEPSQTTCCEKEETPIKNDPDALFSKLVESKLTALMAQKDDLTKHKEDLEKQIEIISEKINTLCRVNDIFEE